MRTSSKFALLAALILTAACQGTPLPRAQLRAGTPDDAVVKLIGRAPERRTTFALQDQSAVKYTVLEYELAPRKGAPEVRHWLLFNRRALIGFGQGGVKEAKALALDTYYGWMADNGQMGRTEAERRLLAHLRTVYGTSLNPDVEAYFALRVATIEGAEGRKLTAEAAERLIERKLAETRPFNRPAPAPTTASAGGRRYAELVRIGLDVRSSRAPHRPRAGAPKRSLGCSRGKAAGATAACL